MPEQKDRVPDKLKERREGRQPPPTPKPNDPEPRPLPTESDPRRKSDK